MLIVTPTCRYRAMTPTGVPLKNLLPGPEAAQKGIGVDRRPTAAVVLKTWRLPRAQPGWNIWQSPITHSTSGSPTVWMPTDY